MSSHFSGAASRSTLDLMPTVFRKKDSPAARFHKDDACPYLVKGPPRGKSREIEEIDLREVKRAVPCKWCYRDAPRATSVHLICRECQGAASVPRPCPHNGGVLVRMTRVRRKETLLQSPGDTYERHDYVWPENLRHFTN